MPDRLEIAKNWLPRYTGMPLDNFGEYPHDIGPSSRSFREDITDPLFEFPGEARSFAPSAPVVSQPREPCK